MMLVIDEYNLGGVTPGTLNRLVDENGSPQAFIDSFLEDEGGILKSLVCLINKLILI
jgi:hypothetical protein